MDKLDSHILNCRKYVLLPRKPDQRMSGIEVLTFEALGAVNSTQAIRAFANDVHDGGTGAWHFENKTIANFWELYDGLAPDFKWMHRWAETQERRKFARRPLYIATADSRVIGGLWVDTVFAEKYGRRASIHIFTASTYRDKGVAEAVLDAFEEEAKRKYYAVSCGWGPRKDCSPARFFAKRGYAIREENHGGIACKTFNTALPKYDLVSIS